MANEGDATEKRFVKSTEGSSQIVTSPHKDCAYAHRPRVAGESRPFSGDTPDVPGKLGPCRASVRNATRHLGRK